MVGGDKDGGKPAYNSAFSAMDLLSQNLSI
jgi:hypothetical protein